MAREMKDSGIEWIGVVPKDWTVCKQKYVLSLVNGRAYSDYEFETDGKYRILRVGNLFSNPLWYTSSLELEPEKYCEDGDLLYAWSMSYAPVIWHGEKVIYHYHIWKTMLTNLIDKKFTYYYLWTLTDALMAEKHETTMSFVTMGVMNNSFIAFPLIAAQYRISAFLDRECSQIDSVIEQTRASIDEYKKLKQAVITQAVTKGIRPGRKMKDSGVKWIGEIPNDWMIGKAKYYVSIKNGMDPKTEGDIPVYGSGANSFKTCGEYKEGPCVLVGRKGATLHIPHYINHRYWNVDTAFDVKALSSFYLKYYYYAAICFDYNYYISQTTLPGMTQTNYENMFIPVPKLEEQIIISEYLDRQCFDIDQMINKKLVLITELESYKKSLIYEYVTGKKEVPACQ